MIPGETEIYLPGAETLGLRVLKSVPKVSHCFFMGGFFDSYTTD